MRIPIIIFSLLFLVYATYAPTTNAAVSCSPLFFLDPSGAVDASQPSIRALDPCSGDTFLVYGPSSKIFGTPVDFAVSPNMKACAILHMPSKEEWEVVVVSLPSGAIILRSGGQTCTWAWGSEVSFSPDGSRIAVGIRACSTRTSSSTVHLFDVPGAGAGGTTGSDEAFDRAWSPAWSPDGEELVVAKSGSASLGVLDSDTLSVRLEFYPYGRCTADLGCCAQVDWAPDGGYLAFSDSTVIARGIPLGMQGANGSGAWRFRYADWSLPDSLAGSYRVKDFACSPDGSWIGVLATCFETGDNYILALSARSADIEVLMGPSQARWISRIDW